MELKTRVYSLIFQKIFWILVPYGLGGLGLFFYISRIPERIVPPGQVDLCGASHQLWHIFILAGLLIN